jgi:two-component system C4-dicarboxylate transport sensor histidine kinase DctB
MFALSRLQWIVVIAFLAAVAAFSGGVWWYSYGAGLDALERRGQSDLALAASGLTRELEQYRALAVLTAGHPSALPAMRGEVAQDDMQALMREIADKSGAFDIILADPTGTVLAATYPGALPDLQSDAFFARALHGAMGVGHFYSDIYSRRAFLFAAPVFSEAGPVAGVLIVVADIEALEASWRGDWPAMFFTDEAGVIFLSNRSELVFRNRFGAEEPFVRFDAQTVRGRDLWRVDGGRYLPRRALHLTQDLPVIEMHGEMLLDVAPVHRLALMQGLVAAALCLTFGMLLLTAMARRRALSVLNSALEQRVNERTAALQMLNTDLQHEVAERIAAEAALKKAQADLVQAGKLAALGHMSAGISHELNQPLMAIRSFAENAQGFLARDQPDVATQNLGRISDMARRMGRIIQNLRSFARQESAPIRDVDIVAIIDAAVETVGPKAQETDAKVIWHAPATVIKVQGGEVRLQQVIVNLLSNAMDAMVGCAERRVTLAVTQTVDKAVITVTDTGPGITEPEKIFDPFYTTKAVGGGDGMGLGLSLSYGLVQSFGGVIRGRNMAQGGAEFTVELDLAKQD